MANPNPNLKKSVSWIIIAVTVTLILLCVVCAPTNAGVSPDVGRAIGDEINGTSAIIGETNLSFVNATGVLIPNGTIKSNWADSHIVIPFEGPFDSSRYEDKLVEGEYKVEGRVGKTTISTIIYFVSPKLDVKTKVYGEDFSWVTKGANITFEGDTNLWIIKGEKPNNITYKLIDPNTLPLREVNGISITNIKVDINGKNSITINTTGMKTGVYTLSIETDPATNNGLDKEGPSVSFEVRSKGITLEANREKQTVTKEIVFTVSTTPHTNITLNITWGDPLNVWFKEGVGDVKYGWGGHSVFGTSDKDGKFVAEASFADTGSYEVTATELEVNTTDSIFVEIVQYEAKVSTDKSTYHIGENVKISGSATAGESITLKVDGEVLTSGEPVEGFDYTWKTGEKSPGSYKIATWVLPFSDPSRDPPDASVSILLIRGGLFAKPSTDFVALGDDFTIKGTAPGRERVDILTIAPEGGSGNGFDPEDILLVETEGKLDAPGLTYSTCGVDTDGTFGPEKIAVREKMDTGTYLIAALNYGRDREWGTSGSDNLLNVISKGYSTPLGIKTTDQLLAILKDKTINVAGSDDLLGIATIKVEDGFVTLDEIEDVPLGKAIEVTGTTNRKVGTPIIVTVEGMYANATKLKPKIATVEADEENFYNKFSVSFDTTTANIGKYEVTADDSDGHTATTTVTILPAEEPSVNISITPTPENSSKEHSRSGSATATTPQMTTLTTTPAPTPRTETKTEKEPGFEIIFTVAGLLVVVVMWLLRRRKKR